MKYKIGILIGVAMWVGWGFVAKPSHGAEFGGVNIHGFISQGYILSNEYNFLASDSKDGSFQYNEMGFNFTSDLTNNLHLGGQFFARDLGDAGNNTVTVDWAYGDYRWRDWFGIRVGRIKLPISLYNETRDVDMLRTNIVMPQSVYDDMVRDTIIAANGVGFYGHISMAAAGSMDYQVVGGGMNVDMDSGARKYYDNTLGDLGHVNGQIALENGYGGILRWNTPLEGLTLAGYFFLLDINAPAHIDPLNTDVVIERSLMRPGVGIEYSWENLNLTFEYVQIDMEDSADKINYTDENTAEGYYLSAGYRFSDLFELGTYYSVYYQNKDDKDGDEWTAVGLPDHRAWTKDLALSFRFDLSDNCVLKLEGHMVNGTGLVLNVDNRESDFSEEDWYYGAAKVTFNF